MKFRLVHVIAYMAVFWIAAAFSRDSELALGLCYVMGTAVIVAVFAWLIVNFFKVLKK